jgi:pSer/pThr/pTyr-binding forkhead associated (FHA) protein
MSRNHAALVYSESQWFVEDLDSTNGTLLNGSRTSRSPVKSGDEIQLGRLILRVKFKEEVAVA